MNARDIITTAVASTFRSKLRTTLTVIAIFIGAFTLTITTAIGTGVSDYINNQVASVGAHNVMTVTKAVAAASSSDSGPQKYRDNEVTAPTGTTASPPQAAPGTSAAALSKTDITKIRAVGGVLTVTPSVQISPEYIQYTGHAKYAMSLSATAGGTWKPGLASGAQLSSSTSVNQVLIPTTYVHNLGLKTDKGAVGKTVTIGLADYAGVQRTVTATIVGVQNASLFGSDVSANRALTTQLQTVQATGEASTVKAAYAAATITFATDATSSQVATLKKDLKAKGFTGQTVADVLGTVETVINGIVGVLDAFAIIALIAAGFGIINTLLMSVQERTREIGLMKAMGMGSGSVFALFSLEAVFIGLLGSAIGAGAAIALGSLISHVLATGVLSSLPGLNLLQFAPGLVATIILIVMATAFLAGTLPARRASRQNPIEALRYE